MKNEIYKGEMVHRVALQKELNITFSGILEKVKMSSVPPCWDGKSCVLPLKWIDKEEATKLYPLKTVEGPS